MLLAVTALPVLEWGPDKPSTTHPSASMTMAFAIVSFSAVNLGPVMRREREPAWSRPLFPFLGWIILGWILTWAAVELGMFQRLLDTQSLTGGQWLVVLALSLVMPAAVWADQAIQLRRQRETAAGTAEGLTAEPLVEAASAQRGLSRGPALVQRGHVAICSIRG